MAVKTFLRVAFSGVLYLLLGYVMYFFTSLFLELLFLLGE
jgi:hypothetical protein